MLVSTVLSRALSYRSSGGVGAAVGTRGEAGALRLAHLCVVSRESTVLVGDDCAVTDLSSATRLFT